MLCELESVQVLEMPAEVLEPHVAGPQSQDEDRTLKQELLEYCLVLGAGDEDLRLVVDSVALFQKAGVGVPVPKWYDVWLVRGTVAQLDEHLLGKVEVLDGAGDVRLDLTWCDAQQPKHWQVVGAGAGAGPNLQHAGVVLVDLEVLGKDGAVGGDVGRAQVGEGVVVSGAPQFENECATQG